MMLLPTDRQSDLFAHAQEFVDRTVPYRFTESEQAALECFFTNLMQRIFLMHGLPSNVMTALAAMYSRMKNPRGVRGTFVDGFLPAILASTLEEVQAEPWNGDAAKFLKAKGITTLDGFIAYRKEDEGSAECAFMDFLDGMRTDPKYLKEFTNAKRVKTFLMMWLDKYGHNSIGRMGFVCICAERISLLAAKSIEWARVGTGFIELSTRFVDMNGAELYDICREYGVLGSGFEASQTLMTRCLQRYAELSGGEAFNGPLPTFYRKRYENLYVDDAAGFQTGIIGETCDLLGNLLPAATLTSVCATASGEAFSSVLRHLLLDGTPENHAIVNAVLREAEKIGVSQFCRHFEPTAVEIRGWSYLSSAQVYPERPTLFGHTGHAGILHAFSRKEGFESVKDMADIASFLFSDERTDHDKLPREFENAIASFEGTMSFRGWRDIHRQSLSTHRRTLLTPNMGFYEYDKPHPDSLAEAFRATARESKRVWDGLQSVPPFMRQYMLPLGFNVGYSFACNLRQLEFCLWQRTDWSVNHEVRKEFLAMEEAMRETHSWWPLFSRAELEPAYIFARGKKPIPLSVA